MLFAFFLRVEGGPPLSLVVAMTSNVKSGQQIFLGLHEVFVLGASAKSEPVSVDG